jgi:hypothetical protein
MNIDEITQNIEDNHNKQVDISSYFTPWGDQSMTAQKQGWYPESIFPDQTVYRARYNAPFNTVVIPGEQQPGHLALIGHPNQKFDVVIRNSNGDIKQTIFKAISPQDVQTWLTSPQNTVSQRVTQIAADPSTLVMK